MFEEDGEEAADSQWFSVTSTAAMRAAMEAILKTSEVLQCSLAADKTMDDVTKEVVSDVNALSRTFDLHLDDPHVPAVAAVVAQRPCVATCRQMFDCTIRCVPVHRIASTSLLCTRHSTTRASRPARSCGRFTCGTS